MWIKEKKIWSIKLFYSDAEGNKSHCRQFSLSFKVSTGLSFIDHLRTEKNICKSVLWLKFYTMIIVVKLKKEN